MHLEKYLFYKALIIGLIRRNGRSSGEKTQTVPN